MSNPDSLEWIRDEEEYDPSHYTKEWVSLLIHTNKWVRNVFLGAIIYFDSFPYTVLDLGSGTGVVGETCRRLNIDVTMVDIIPSEEAGFIHHDLREPLNLDRQFDLVWCTEVVEHLPEDASDTICDTMVNHTGRYLIITAANLGQGGYHHINNQPPEFWRDKIVERGLVYNEELTEKIRETWKWVSGPCSWYPNNIQVFERIE